MKQIKKVEAKLAKISTVNESELEEELKALEAEEA
jgi:hypothetical protein